MSKCEGCGSLLQNSDKNLIGYTSKKENNLCERCFRIRNYNEYKYVFKDNQDYIEILKNINKTDDLVILVVDLFNISKDLIKIKEYLDNKILLVLTKRDILPKSCYDKKLEDYFDLYNLNIVDKEIISSKKNYKLTIESEDKIVHLGECLDLSTQMLFVKEMLQREKGIEGDFFVNMDLNEGNPVFREKV